MVDPSELYDGHELLSSHLTWEPQGEQAAVFAHHPPGPTNPGIVLAKLRPGQEVEIECHAVKGVGMDHAKFSPVGTTFHKNEDVFTFLTDEVQLRPHTAFFPLSP
jgi:DNA-directed RNA polymerases I and III subunit RPAC1